MLFQHFHLRNVVVQRTVVFQLQAKRAAASESLTRGELEQGIVKTDHGRDGLPTEVEVFVPKNIVETFFVEARTMLYDLSSIFCDVVKSDGLRIVGNFWKVKSRIF